MKYWILDVGLGICSHFCHLPMILYMWESILPRPTLVLQNAVRPRGERFLSRIAGTWPFSSIDSFIGYSVWGFCTIWMTNPALGLWAKPRNTCDLTEHSSAWSQHSFPAKAGSLNGQ